MADDRHAPLEISDALHAEAEGSKAWPFEEARKLVARFEKTGTPQTVLFETGYGPSGLPHIGTFGEVARTSMVRTAFRVLTHDRVATRLLSFSDDLDGMRKIPDTVPDPDALKPYLGQPLTSVPNPFEGAEKSFGGHNNAMLRRFLDGFGFDYEFASATEVYRSGRFDEHLLRMLGAYDAVMEIMLPTLREERRRTYSPFLPLHPETGVVMQVPVEERNAEAGTIVWTDPETGRRFETPVTGGHAKAQWKPDWALRWAALGVHYEMAGKDHIDNVKISSRICRAIGGTPPEGFNYELFLDEKGQKISKSKGNGITIDEWLAYASPESLSLYMFQKPREAKRLHFDVIPKAVDEYYGFVAAQARQDLKQQLQNPVWHIHAGQPPRAGIAVPFAMLLNLVSASNAGDKGTLWGYITRYAPTVTPQSDPELDRLVGYALRYFKDFVEPAKRFRVPDAVERQALETLDEKLGDLPADAGAEVIQDAILDVARPIERYQDLKKAGPNGGPGVTGEWFQALYQTLIGAERGPRFGSFVSLYGIEETRGLIRKALAGELVNA